METACCFLIDIRAVFDVCAFVWLDDRPIIADMRCLEAGLSLMVGFIKHEQSY